MKIEIEITDEAIAYCVCTWVESTQWGRIVSLDDEPSPIPDHLAPFARDVGAVATTILAGGAAIILDVYAVTPEELEAADIADDGDELDADALDRWASAGGKTYRLDAEAVKRGVALVAAGHAWLMPGIVEGDADVEGVDVLMQLALFGELIYG